MNMEARLERLEALISSLLVEQKEVLNINEAADFLGISKSHLYKHTSTSNIPFYRPEGKKIYFKKSELESWLLRNKSADNSEDIASTWDSKVKTTKRMNPFTKTIDDEEF